MPDQYSGTIRSSAGSARLSLAHAVRRPVSISSGRNRCPATQWPTGTDPAFTNYMNDLSFSSPRQLPVRPLAASDRHVRSAHDHQPPVRRPPYPRFHATELPLHGLTRAMLLEEIRRTIIPDSGHRVDRVDYHFFMKLAAVRADWRNTAATTSVMLRGMGSFFHSTPT